PYSLLPKASTRRRRLRDSTTRTLRFTDSFELPMALSPQSTLRAPPFRPSLTVSTRRGRLRDPTSTRRFRRKIYFTDSFELPTEPLLHLTLRGMCLRPRSPASTT